MEDIITVDNLIFEYTDEDTGEKNRVLDNVSLNLSLIHISEPTRH